MLSLANNMCQELVRCFCLVVKTFAYRAMTKTFAPIQDPRMILESSHAQSLVHHILCLSPAHPLAKYQPTAAALTGAASGLCSPTIEGCLFHLFVLSSACHTRGQRVIKCTAPGAIAEIRGCTSHPNAPEPHSCGQSS